MKSRLAAAATGAALVLALLAVPVTAASAPANDNFADAAQITSLPYSDSVDASLATVEADEPTNYGSWTQSVWYEYTAPGPGPVGLSIDLAGTDYTDAAVTAYVQDPSYPWYFNSLNPSPIGGASLAGSGRLTAPAGQPVYFQVVAAMGSGPNLAFTVDVYPPPANDNFPGTSITTLPFSGDYDLFGATRETGEPMPGCASDSPTVWYQYTPPSASTLTASVSDYGTNLAVYTGSSISGLTLLQCAAWGQKVTFKPDASTTYYFQVGGQYGQVRAGTLFLVVTPPPTVSIYFGPADPSIYDVMQFYGWPQDGGGIGAPGPVWDFGDGSTATGNSVTHTYATDGDYTVTATATTFDGRTGSSTTSVSVRTHDVAITRFDVPTAASAGQTRTITVGLSNHRYAETAQLLLYRGVPSAYWYWEQIAQQTVSVSVLRANRTTNVTFPYTFTTADATVGKVAFRVILQLATARDALPADNEMTAPATKVRAN
jgi:hypothetical protein